MKKLFVFMLLASFGVFADENFTLAENVTTTAPYSGNVAWISPEVSNNNGLNSLKIDVKYQSVTPAGCACQVTAVIEEELSQGVWVAIATQNQAINSLLIANTRVIVYRPQFVADPGSDIFIDANGGIRISNFDGIAPSKFRVKLVFKNFGTPDFGAVTFSAYGRKYDS